MNYSFISLEMNPLPQIALCALTPKTISDIASKATEFYCYQKGVESEFRLSKLARREEQMAQLEKSYQEKLLEASNKISLLAHQLEASKAESDARGKELQELKEKYAEKSRYVWMGENLLRSPT